MVFKKLQLIGSLITMLIPTCFSITRYIDIYNSAKMSEINSNQRILWSILICSLPSRVASLTALVSHLTNLVNTSKLQDAIEILICLDNGEHTTGYKRNVLVNQSLGEYVCFIDDDDDVTDRYIDSIYQAMQSKPDVITLNGLELQENIVKRAFIYSSSFASRFEIKNNGCWSNIQFSINLFVPNLEKLIINDRFLKNFVILGRYITPLNPIRKSIATQCSFPDHVLGEDSEYLRKVRHSNLIHTEKNPGEIVYIYKRETATLIN